MKEKVLRSFSCSNKPKNFWMELGVSKFVFPKN